MRREYVKRGIATALVVRVQCPECGKVCVRNGRTEFTPTELTYPSGNRRTVVCGRCFATYVVPSAAHMFDLPHVFPKHVPEEVQ